MKIRTTLLIIVAVLLAGLLLFLWHTSVTQVEKELVLAENDANQALAVLVKAGEATAEKRRELAWVREDSAAVIKETEAKLFNLQKEAAASRATIAQLTGVNSKLKEHIDGLSSPEVELEPLPIKDVIIEGIALYPERNLEDAEIQANAAGLELFQLVVTEVRDRRVYDQNNEAIIAECQDQNARLEAAIGEHEKKSLAMGRSYQSQSEYISLLEAEAVTCKEWGNKMQTQVDLYKKKASWGWIQKTGMVAAIAGAFYLGSQMP